MLKYEYNISCWEIQNSELNPKVKQIHSSDSNMDEKHKFGFIELMKKYERCVSDISKQPGVTHITV